MRELRARDPVVQLRVFKVRTYSAGVFLMTVLGFVLYGSLLLVPIFLQTLAGLPGVECRHRHGAARIGLVSDDALGRHGARPLRPAQGAGGRAGGGLVDALRAVAT